MVKLLLAKDGVDPDSKDSVGRTPLWWAAENGHEAVVKLLLAKDGVDPDSKDSFGRTPLSWAAANGHEAVVKLLLAKDGVDPDSKDSFGQTPLSWAAENGHEAVVKLLLAKDGVDPDSKDRMVRRRCRGPQRTGTRRWSSCCSRRTESTQTPKTDGSDAAVVGRRERARGGGQAAAREGRSRPGLQGQLRTDAAVVGRSDGHEAVVKLLQSRNAYNAISAQPPPHPPPVAGLSYIFTWKWQIERRRKPEKLLNCSRMSMMRGIVSLSVRLAHFHDCYHGA